MPLPRAITGGAPLWFGGRRWWLRITHQVLLDCEEATGVDMLSAGAEVQDPSARLLRALLWSALRGAGASWSAVEVGAQLGSLGAVRRAHEAVVEAWIGSMPPPEKDRRDGPAGKPLTWPEAWARACGRSGLGLSDEAWLAMTPLQLHALRRVELEEMQRMELLVGIVASTVANYGARAPKRALRAESFMLHPFEREERGPVTGEMLMAVLAPIKAELAKKKE